MRLAPGLWYTHKILITTINMTNVSVQHTLHYLESHKHTHTRTHLAGIEVALINKTITFPAMRYIQEQT